LNVYKLVFSLFLGLGSVDLGAARIAILGHLRSVLNYPVAQQALLSELNNYPSKLDAVVFLGDITAHGTQEEWKIVKSLLKRVRLPKFYVPGNHDLRSPGAVKVWMKEVGYLAKRVRVKDCQLFLLNSVNQREVKFDWNRMTAGGGLDSRSVRLLQSISPNPIHRNIILMHHSLYSAKLWEDDQPGLDQGRYSQFVHHNESIWRKKVHPLIVNRVRAVFSGDGHSQRPSYSDRNGVKYFASGFRKRREPLSYMVLNTSKDKREIKVDLRYISMPFASSWYQVP